MILYHGTSDIHLNSIVQKGFKVGTWFASNNWHGFKIANRTVKRDGGNPIVLEVEINDISRIIGRNNPSYRYNSGKYKIVSILTITRKEVKE